MNKKKVALYVEGQSEQIFINHFLLTWWYYSDIRIDNIKLVNNLKNPVPNFNETENYKTYFLIINVEGSGSIISALCQRLDKQVEKGFEVIGLRDLDFENSSPIVDAVNEIPKKLKKYLSSKGVKYFEKMNLYFAIMTIESWMLAFNDAIAKWASISKDELIEKIKESRSDLNLEKIRNPKKLLSGIGNRGRDLNSYHEMKSLVKHISYDDIQQVYHSYMIPSFSKFWEKLLSIAHLP